MKIDLNRFASDRLGNIAILFALLMPVCLGMLGLVIDVGIARSQKNHMLTIAEASALAASVNYQDKDRDAARERAKKYASLNSNNLDNVVTDAEIEFGEWIDRTFIPGPRVNAIRVTASRTTEKNNAVRSIFTSFFGKSFWDVASSAVVLLEPDPVCILTLNATRNDAFDIDPEAKIVAPDCTVHVNSRHRGALEIGAKAMIQVKSLSVVGGVEQSASASVQPKPVTGAQPMADPYASLVPPVNDRCGGPKQIRRINLVLTPDLAFCGGLEIDAAQVTLQPGVYVIKDRFEMRNGASITGDDVLIYLEGKGTDFFFHSRTSFNLKAATTGPYAGVVLWSDRRNTRDHDIYSKFGARSEGTIYTPSSQVEFENDVVWEASCIRLVVDRLELDNRSKYASTNTKKGCRNNILTARSRLVR